MLMFFLLLGGSFPVFVCEKRGPLVPYDIFMKKNLQIIAKF